MTEQEKAQLAEAPASVNFYGVSQEGWNLQFTLRDIDEYALMERLKKFFPKLKETFHIQPKAVGQQPASIPQPAGNSSQLPPPPEPPEQTQAQGQAHSSDDVFDAGELQATVDGGKVYWKVTGAGGKFPKFPVTIWPETMIAAGFDPETMNVMKPVNLAGWKAYYARNEKGNPQKVVRLMRPQP